MRKILLIICIVSVGLVNSCKETPKESSKLITAEELQELAKLDDAQLVDIRTPEEYEEGFIEGFENIDFLADTFDENIKKLDKNKPVIVYCRSGGRSARCTKKMVEAGFTMVYDLDGGITQWMQEGFEVQDSQE